MSVYKLAKVLFDTERCTLAAKNREVYIGPLATRLLYYMIERRDKVLSREDLAYSVWGYPAKGHTITQAMATLRSHFTTLDPAARNIIVTVPKRGYRLKQVSSIAENSPASSQQCPSTMNILVVDDHPFVRKMHQEMLGQLGFEHVDACNSAEGALHKLCSNHYHCVLVDLELEVMNGLELVKRIRMGDTGKTAGEALTFVITVHTNPKILGTALLLDVNAFLPKPVELVDLRQKFAAVSMTEFRYKPRIAYERVDTDIENYFQRGLRVCSPPLTASRSMG